MSGENKLFVSHAVVDSAVSQPFVELLMNGIGIPFDTIFFSGNKGQGIKPGADFKESIRKSLDDATTVIALISENYYNSPFCMCELGGTWLEAKDFLPIIVPPLKFKDLKAVLIGLQASCINKKDDLDELRDELIERLEIKKPRPTPKWNQECKKFLGALDGYLEEIPETPIIQRSEYDQIVEQLEEYTDELETCYYKSDKLEEKITKLKAAKDATAVAEIEFEDLEDKEIFDNLVENFKETLSSLERITVETIFANARGKKANHPGRDYDWDEARDALEYKEVELCYDDNAICLNDGHPKVNAAMDACSRLSQWIEEESSEDFYNWYEEEYGGYQPDLSDRTFWDTHVL